MEISNEKIDSGKAFDWGKISSDYARYRDIYPQIFYEKVIERNLCLNRQKVLDIGTGSGCIAVSLAAELRHSAVTALDVSAEALAIAVENATFNHTAVAFVLHDILQADLPPEFASGTFDVIVSNPPYVTDRERNLMRPNVLNHEPALALFVPDNDPLQFYRAIAKHGRTLLRPGGALYFEINEQFGSEMLQLLHTEGYTGAELRRDIFDKERMVRAWRN